MGFFEFRLCPKTSSEELVTQECLNQNLLTLADGTTQFNVEQNTVAVVFAIQVQLPAEITCENCVLQWYYRASKIQVICLTFCYSAFEVAFDV